MTKSLLPESLKDKSNLALEECMKEALDIDITKFMKTPVQGVKDELLPVLAKEAHILGVEGWNIAQTRREKENLIIDSVMLHAKKGSKPSIENAFQSLGIEAEVKEWFKYGGKIGHFRLELIKISNRAFASNLEKQIYEVIKSYKPARALLDKINYFVCNKGFIYTGARLKAIEKSTVKTMEAVIL